MLSKNAVKKLTSPKGHSDLLLLSTESISTYYNCVWYLGFSAAKSVRSAEDHRAEAFRPWKISVAHAVFVKATAFA